MHLSSYQLNRYRHARLEPAELLSLDDHLEQCEICRRQLRGQGNLSAALSSLQVNLQTVTEEIHLPLTQCAAFINNDLQAVERELVVSHLDDCSACTTQLQAYRNSISEPKSTLGHALLVILDSWRERLTLVWPMPVAAAIVLALVALVDNVYWRPKPQPQTPEQIQQATAPKSSENPVTTRPKSEIVETAKTDQPEPEQLAQITFPPELAALRGESTTRGKQGIAPGFQLTHPIGTFVLSPCPILRWQTLPGATSYTVKVFSTDYELIAESPVLQATAWTLPTALARGKTYIWQVMARKNEEEVVGAASVAEAKFVVLDRARARSIERAKRITNSPLALSIAYAQAGLLDDAEALLKAAPPSAGAKKLLQQVRQERRK